MQLHIRATNTTLETQASKYRVHKHLQINLEVHAHKWGKYYVTLSKVRQTFFFITQKQYSFMAAVKISYYFRSLCPKVNENIFFWSMFCFYIAYLLETNKQTKNILAWSTEMSVYARTHTHMHTPTHSPTNPCVPHPENGSAQVYPCICMDSISTLFLLSRMAFCKTSQFSVQDKPVLNWFHKTTSW